MGALVAGLGMGIAGDLFGKPKTQNQTSTSTFQMSPWEEQYWQNMTQKAQQVANTPYTAYTGNRVAPLSSEQQSSINNTVNNANNWQAPLAAAQAGYQNAMTPFNANSVNQYMSPYLGDVIGNIERIGNENFSAPGGVGETIANDFAGLGQFGSKRMGDVMNRAGELNDRETQGAVSNALQAGYGQAEQQYNADQTRNLWGAGGLSSLAGQTQALTTGTSNALMSAGNLEQQEAQNILNVPYQNYLAAQQWPDQQLEVAGSIRPPNEGTTSNTQPVPIPNDFQNFMGGVGMYEGMSQDGMFNGLGGGSDYIPSSGASTGFTMGMPTGTYGANPMVPYEFSGVPYRKGGLAALKHNQHVLDADGDDDNNADALMGGALRLASGGWIKGAIKHPGALHRMLGVPQGHKIPAKKLHKAAEAGGVLGRRARFAEELESFHHAEGGPVGYADGGHFIARAIKHPGALHRELHVPLGQKIPAKKLERASHAGGKLGERARFAETLKGMHHAEGGVISFPSRKVLRVSRSGKGGLSALAA